VSADVHFADEPEGDGETNYLGVGARYNLADANESGYWVKLYSDGIVELKKDSVTLQTSSVENPDTGVWHRISITVTDNIIKATVDDKNVFSCKDTDSPVSSGRVALYSALQKNYFDNLSVSEVDGYEAYITRWDNLDDLLSYSEGSNEDTKTGWYHNTMCSYKNYHRTLSTGYPGASLSFSFEGCAFALIGAAASAVLSVEVDGKFIETGYAADATGNRRTVYANYDLSEGLHTVKITVLSGTLDVDAVEFQ
jgi:hypothetical protein